MPGEEGVRCVGIAQLGREAGAGEGEFQPDPSLSRQAPGALQQSITRAAASTPLAGGAGGVNKQRAVKIGTAAKGKTPQFSA